MNIDLKYYIGYEYINDVKTYPTVILGVEETENSNTIIEHYYNSNMSKSSKKKMWPKPPRWVKSNLSKSWMLNHELGHRHEKSKELHNILYTTITKQDVHRKVILELI